MTRLLMVSSTIYCSFCHWQPTLGSCGLVSIDRTTHLHCTLRFLSHAHTQHFHDILDHADITASFFNRPSSAPWPHQGPTFVSVYELLHSSAMFHPWCAHCKYTLHVVLVTCVETSGKCVHFRAKRRVARSVSSTVAVSHRRQYHSGAALSRTPATRVRAMAGGTSHAESACSHSHRGSTL